MKRVYIQPTTQQIQLNGEPLCDELLLVGSMGNSVNGKWGNAPGRKVTILYV